MGLNAILLTMKWGGNPYVGGYEHENGIPGVLYHRTSKAVNGYIKLYFIQVVCSCCSSICSAKPKIPSRKQSDVENPEKSIVCTDFRICVCLPQEDPKEWWSLWIIPSIHPQWPENNTSECHAFFCWHRVSCWSLSLSTLIPSILFPHVVLLDLSDALPAWDLDPLLVLETVPVHADRGDSGCSDEFAAVESSTIACWLVILCYYSGLGFLVGESIINSEKKYRCPESNMEVSHLEAQLKLQMGMLSPWMYTPTSWGKNPFNFPWLWFYRDLDLELHFQPMSSLDS